MQKMEPLDWRGFLLMKPDLLKGPFEFASLPRSTCAPHLIFCGGEVKFKSEMNVMRAQRSSRT